MRTVSKSKYKALLFLIAREGEAGRSGGGHRIATEIRKNGWDVEVIDFFRFWTFEEIKQLLISRIDDDMKFIGFGSLFLQWPELAEQTAAWIKENHPNLLIIYGSQTFAEINTKHIDYQITGYAETIFIKLLKYLFDAGEAIDFTTVKGRKVAQGGWDAAPWRDPVIIYEDRDFLQHYEWISIEFSRGCKFVCDYCNHPMIGVKGDWTRDADSFERQIKDAHDRFGITRYMISDETFNDRTEKITKFADVVQQLDFQPFFWAFIRPDLLVKRGQKEWDELIRMQVVSHLYGIETFGHESGKAIGKGMNPEILQQGLIDAKNYFHKQNDGLYRATITLIAGLPHDSEAQVDANFQWITENWQGENVVANVLDIPKKNAFDHLNQNSKMTMDYAKYGYEIATEEEQKEYLNMLKDYDNYNHITGFRPNNVMWKNKHTNWGRMAEWVELMYYKFHENDIRYPIQKFFYTAPDKPIRELLAYNYKKDSPKLDLNYEMVENYKRNKLNY
jgi:radical SAM superfamily enzyme YgiQ (UPF0313 family)